jgi:glucuronoarabinoxylan endo-1,4-beta-xylanase
MHTSKFIYIAILYVLMAAGCSKNDNPVDGSSDNIPGMAYIYMDDVQQIIRGFGGQNMPGWNDVGDLTADQVTKAFGTGDGQIGMSILRIRVPYDSTQFYLEVPTAQRVRALGITTIFASPWTPPPSLKSNTNIVGGTLNPDMYAAYAAYLKSFADYMSGNGVPLYAISIQNEPDCNVTYESCDWNASQMLGFVKNNAPAIGTRIIVPESQNFDHALSDPLLNDDAAAANISIIGGHIYGGGLTSYPLAVSKGKEVWMTEHLAVDTNWSGAITTAREINDCMNAGMNAYVWWYIRRFYGPINDNSEVTKRGYVISQYARFVRPGFYRISATAIPQTGVYVTAYKDGSKLVIVAINKNSSSSINQEFTIRNGSVTTFTRYVTSSTLNCAVGSDVTVSGVSFSAALEPWSVTTFVSN